MGIFIMLAVSDEESSVQMIQSQQTGQYTFRSFWKQNFIRQNMLIYPPQFR